MYKNKKILATHSKGPVFEWRRIYSNFYRGGFDPSVDEELENTLFTEHFTHRLSSCDGCQPSQYEIFRLDLELCLTCCKQTHC